MNSNDSASSSGKVVGIGLAIVLVLAVGAWFATRSPDDTPDTDPKASGHAEVAQVTHGNTAGPPANLPPAPDAGAPVIAQTEHVPPANMPEAPPPPVDDAPNQGDGDGPEVAPFAIPNVESRVEREMSFAEKAGQTRVMITRIDERATRVEARLAEARQSGNAADIHLQEVLLQRLRQRSGQLAQQAAHEEQEATQEAADGPAEPEDTPPEQDPSQAP